MATPAELEVALIARIQGAVPEGVLAKAYPDNPRTYKIFAPAEVLVVFRGGDYEPPRKTDLVIQERTLQFELSVVVRSLSGHTGAYGLLETVRKAIQGWKPALDCLPAFILKDQFLGMESGQWWWAVFVATRTRVLPVLEPGSGAPFSRISLNSNGEPTQIP
jgi:hypothetical protein